MLKKKQKMSMICNIHDFVMCDFSHVIHLFSHQSKEISVHEKMRVLSVLIIIIILSFYSNNSLFAVPANQEFVFIHTSVSTATDPVNFYLNLMRQSSPLIADKGERRVRYFA